MFRKAIIHLNVGTLIVLVVSGCTSLLHSQLPIFIGVHKDCQKAFATDCKIQCKRQSSVGCEIAWLEELRLPSLLIISCSARYILDKFSGISFRNFINPVLRE